MKIATWNVNSIKARLEHLLVWLKQENPDIVLLQELKCQTEAFPYDQIEDLGFNVAVNGQKTYNGVAVLSKKPLTDVITSFPGNPIPEEARFIEVLVNFSDFAIKVSSVYVPNGQDLLSEKYKIKLEFIEALKNYYKSILSAQESIIMGGDFNVALSDMDVYSAAELGESICFSLQERQALRSFLSTGLVDIYRVLNPMEESYTWWDYRANSFNRNHGLRIDYVFCSSEIAQITKECYISKQWRSKEKPSDHVPVTMLLNL